jgi:hypothetical protein
MWTNARIAAYLTSAAVAGGTIASMFGAADFDSTTGMFDLHPVNIYTAISLVAPIAASTLATVAAMFGWGRK